MSRAVLSFFLASMVVFLPLTGVSQIRSSAKTATVLHNQVTGPVDSADTVTLSGHVPKWVSSSADLGRISDATKMDLVISLKRPPDVQAAFDQLTADQQNPSSSRYHQWLTPAEIGTSFGTTQNDLDAVTRWLTEKGLHVDLIQANRIFIQVSGTAGTISAAFGTSIHEYSQNSAIVRAPSCEPTVPKALASVVQHVIGLTNIPRHGHFVMTPPTANTSTNIGPMTPPGSVHEQPSFVLANGNTTLNWIAPNDFTTLYDLSPVYSSGVKGTGQKVMIIGGSRLNPADLSNWESLSGLPPYSPNYIVGPGFTDPGQTNDDNMGEGTLDFERVYATAPSATVDQVIAEFWLSSGTVNFNLISYAINTVQDPVMSMSFGACEVQEPTGFVQQESALFQQAAAQGISVFASSGDGGVDACETQGVSAQSAQVASISDLCASPYVTCVGGTEFNDTTNTSSYWSTINGTGFETALRSIPEGGWNEPTTTSSSGMTSYVISASGGGASTIIPKPSWQVGAGVPADGFRDVPDVSFSASLHNAYFSCLAYQDAGCVANAQGAFSLTGFGGTSASAPSMAGVAALLDQKLGGRQGNLNPLLYKIFNSTSGAAAFHDATIASSGVSGCSAATPSMCNNSDPSPTALTGGLAGYLLQTGFDEVTGLGSLDVSNLLTAAGSAGLTPTTGSLTAAPVSPAVNQTVTLTATITSSTAGAPSGTVLVTNLGTSAAPASTILGTITLTNGTGKLVLPTTTFSTAGAYNLSAFYSGDATFASSTSTLGLVVTAPLLPTTIAFTPVPAATAANTMAMVTATVSGLSAAVAPTGMVKFLSGATVLATAAVGGNGIATANITLAPGVNALSAMFTGDATYGSSATAAVNVTLPTISLAAATPSLTLASAQSASGTDMVTVSTANGYSGTVTLSCAVALSFGTATVAPGCSVAPASVTFTGTASASMSTTVTLSTVAPHAVTGSSFASLGMAPGSAASGRSLTGLLEAGLSVAGLLGLCLPVLRRRTRWRALAGVVLLMGMLAGLAGCGGGGGSAPAPTGGTTPGAYTVTVTGVSSTGIPAVVTTFSLTVN